MHTYKWLKFLVLSLAIISCGKPIPELEGVDVAGWKTDTNGCGGKRMTMIDAVQEQKDKLLALDELEIVALFGRPDRNELSRRNQKFYYYFLEPSEECAEPREGARKLIIRFNAMGLAKEILVE